MAMVDQKEIAAAMSVKLLDWMSTLKKDFQEGIHGTPQACERKLIEIAL